MSRLVPLAFLLLAGCAPEEEPRAAQEPPEAVCRVAASPVPLPPEVHESSGLAVSSRDPGILWTANDSGGEPVLYALDPAGALLGAVRVAGAENRDWEALAAGPCPAGECLYVGDIGDNDADRRDVEVYRVPEPAPGDRATAPAEVVRLRYPEGPRDAEALFVLSPGELFVATKGTHGPVRLYRAPFRPGETVPLRRVAELSAGEAERLNRVTGASATPDGEWVAVRTYTALHLFRARDLLAGTVPESDRFDLVPLGEPQGEAVSLLPDGTVFLTSEAEAKGGSALLTRLTCTLP